MGGYLPDNLDTRDTMLSFIGMQSKEELFADIPANLLCGALNLPEGQPEMQVRRKIEGLAAQNKVFSSVFRGAGAYRHYIPSIVKQISGKETFMTAYTPYQAEISQGVLQVIFEYQTEICALTGLDVSNASVYDGASAAAEGVAMCRERKRQKAFVAAGSHPDTLQVIQTYSTSAGAPVAVLPEKDGLVDLAELQQLLDEETACVYVQSPNFYGLVEDMQAITQVCHAAGVKVIQGCNPFVLALYKTPGETGVDIAVGEAQPLGMPLSFGGPYLGFMASTTAMMRRLPGRIAGQTTDADGKRCFVLTLQAREQHIRREKSTSSICTNQALCALTATAYMAAMGPGGVRQVAEQCYAKAHYLADELAKAGFAKVHQGEFFHEFVTTCPVDQQVLFSKLQENGILGGLPVQEGILWCVTEMNTKEEMDTLVALCREVAK